MSYTGDNDSDDELFPDTHDDKTKGKIKDGAHKNYVMEDDPFRYKWKDNKEYADEEKMEDIKNVIKLTSYTDSDWKDETLLKNRELEVKYARQHNQNQLQQAIEKVKQGANIYICNFTL